MIFALGEVQAGDVKNDVSSLIAGACPSRESGLACRLTITPLYSGEVSRYFNVAVNGNEDFYQLFPVVGGIGRSRASEDQRLGNLFFSAINTRSLANNGVGNTRTPYVFESRYSNSSGYADSFSGAYFRQRLAGAGHNYAISTVSEKSNFAMLTLDSIVHSAMQGGGFLSMSNVHAAHGDNIGLAFSNYGMGCSEGEDECNKLWRAAILTGTDRWGGDSLLCAGGGHGGLRKLRYAGDGWQRIQRQACWRGYVPREPQSALQHRQHRERDHIGLSRFGESCW